MPQAVSRELQVGLPRLTSTPHFYHPIVESGPPADAGASGFDLRISPKRQNVSWLQFPDVISPAQRWGVRTICSFFAPGARGQRDPALVSVVLYRQWRGAQPPQLPVEVSLLPDRRDEAPQTHDTGRPANQHQAPVQQRPVSEAEVSHHHDAESDKSQPGPDKREFGTAARQDRAITRKTGALGRQGVAFLRQFGSAGGERGAFLCEGVAGVG